MIKKCRICGGESFTDYGWVDGVCQRCQKSTPKEEKNETGVEVYMLVGGSGKWQIHAMNPASYHGNGGKLLASGHVPNSAKNRIEIIKRQIARAARNDTAPRRILKGGGVSSLVIDKDIFNKLMAI